MTTLDDWRAVAASRPGYATYPDTRPTPAPPPVPAPQPAAGGDDQALPHVTRWRWWHRWSQPRKASR